MAWAHQAVYELLPCEFKPAVDLLKVTFQDGDLDLRIAVSMKEGVLVINARGSREAVMAGWCFSRRSPG